MALYHGGPLLHCYYRCCSMNTLQSTALNKVQIQTESGEVAYDPKQHNDDHFATLLKLYQINYVPLH